MSMLIELERNGVILAEPGCRIINLEGKHYYTTEDSKLLIDEQSICKMCGLPFGMHTIVPGKSKLIYGYESGHETYDIIAWRICSTSFGTYPILSMAWLDGFKGNQNAWFLVKTPDGFVELDDWDSKTYSSIEEFISKRNET